MILIRRLTHNCTTDVEGHDKANFQPLDSSVFMNSWVVSTLPVFESANYCCDVHSVSLITDKMRDERLSFRSAKKMRPKSVRKLSFIDIRSRFIYDSMPILGGGIWRMWDGDVWNQSFKYIFLLLSIGPRTLYCTASNILRICEQFSSCCIFIIMMMANLNLVMF